MKKVTWYHYVFMVAIKASVAEKKEQNNVVTFPSPF